MKIKKQNIVIKQNVDLDNMVFDWDMIKDIDNDEEDKYNEKLLELMVSAKETLLEAEDLLTAHPNEKLGVKYLRKIRKILKAMDDFYT